MGLLLLLCFALRKHVAPISGQSHHLIRRTTATSTNTPLFFSVDEYQSRYLRDTVSHESFLQMYRIRAKQVSFRVSNHSYALLSTPSRHLLKLPIQEFTRPLQTPPYPTRPTSAHTPTIRAPSHTSPTAPALRSPPTLSLHPTPPPPSPLSPFPPPHTPPPPPAPPLPPPPKPT